MQMKTQANITQKMKGLYRLCIIDLMKINIPQLIYK